MIQEHKTGPQQKCKAGNFSGMRNPSTLRINFDIDEAQSIGLFFVFEGGLSKDNAAYLRRSPTPLSGRYIQQAQCKTEHTTDPLAGGAQADSF